MEESKDFLVLRYSLIGEQQLSLLAKELPEPKGAAIVAAIDKDTEFFLNGVKYGFVGFKRVEPVAGYNFPSGRFWVGKTAKLRVAKRGEKVPGDIVEHTEDDWVPILTIFDVEDQYIFVQRDWRFGTPEQIARALQRGLRDQVFENYNHKIFVEGLLSKDVFWDVVRKFNKLYKVNLKLISPNILETNKRAKEALKSLRELFDQDEIDLTLLNETGNLKIPQEPVGDYVDYISEGEGSWSIVTEGERGGKKRHSSVENTKIIELTTSSSEMIEEERRIEQETGMPAPSRTLSDARLIAEVYSSIREIRES
ncbi:hypothetical protein [Desulfatitalea alkaliphila]|uniref:Uncharacterized protein n=1 Tax=Desulfatitalea alkaliphila TaxID=2929485 RepID=A0AA41R8W1_9BACT|nr:hypothetical protein [Desulfatitalea alkaliphila]MCJ8503156.1 hypothetical protein [Desulfatitalea alkaliphila]